MYCYSNWNRQDCYTEKGTFYKSIIKKIKGWCEKKKYNISRHFIIMLQFLKLINE
jgi:hypothetical protein